MTNSRVLISLKNHLTTLKNVDHTIAQSIINDPAYFVRVSVKTFATALNTSDASVIRFCKKLGYKSYQEFKDSLSQELLASPPNPVTLNSDIYVDETVNDTVDKLYNIIKQSVYETKTLLKLTAINSIVEKIQQSQRVFFLGLGGSGLSAIEASHKFNRIGIDATGFNETHSMSYKLEHTTAKDIIVSISHSGETEDIIHAHQTAKNCGAFTISITNNMHSRLAELADIKLLTCSEGEIYQGDSIGTRVSQMYILDLIYTELMKQNFEKIISAKSHIRERLLINHKYKGK